MILLLKVRRALFGGLLERSDAISKNCHEQPVRSSAFVAVDYANVAVVLFCAKSAGRCTCRSFEMRTKTAQIIVADTIADLCNR